MRVVYTNEPSVSSSSLLVNCRPASHKRQEGADYALSPLRLPRCMSSERSKVPLCSPLHGTPDKYFPSRHQAAPTAGLLKEDDARDGGRPNLSA